jgi:heterodisulfide reductase subunit B
MPFIEKGTRDVLDRFGVLYSDLEGTTCCPEKLIVADESHFNYTLTAARNIALGCRVCMKCHTGNCSWGITSQRPELYRRIDPREGSVRLANLLRGWSLELKEIPGAPGVNSVESLSGSRSRLRGVGLDSTTLEILGVGAAGVGY